MSDVAVGAHRGGGRWRWPNTKKFISRVKRSFAWTVSRLRWWTFAAALVNAGSDPGGRGAGRGSGAGQHCQARCCAERASARVLGKGLFNAVAQARHCCCCCSAVAVPGQHMLWKLWFVAGKVCQRVQGCQLGWCEITRNHSMACIFADLCMLRQRAWFETSHSETVIEPYGLWDLGRARLG